jgi:hypothetical protein
MRWLAIRPSGTYSGTGAAGNASDVWSSPAAFVMVKRTDSTLNTGAVFGHTRNVDGKRFDTRITIFIR